MDLAISMQTIILYMIFADISVLLLLNFIPYFCMTHKKTNAKISDVVIKSKERQKLE